MKRHLTLILGIGMLIVALLLTVPGVFVRAIASAQSEPGQVLTTPVELRIPLDVDPGDVGFAGLTVDITVNTRSLLDGELVNVPISCEVLVPSLSRCDETMVPLSKAQFSWIDLGRDIEPGDPITRIANLIVALPSQTYTDTISLEFVRVDDDNGDPIDIEDRAIQSIQVP